MAKVAGTVEGQQADLGLEQPAAVTPPEEEGLRGHEEEYGELSQLVPREETEEGDEAPAPRRKHRSRSSQASADEAGRIPKLTGELRTAEERAALAEARAQELEQQLAARSPGPAPRAPSPPAVPSAAVPVPAPAPPTPGAGAGFADPEPKLDAFQNEPDPWLAYTRAWARWDRRKDEFEAGAAQREAQERTETETFQRTERQRIMTLAGDYQGKALAFNEKNPDFQTKIESMKDWPVTPLLVEALFTEGPEIVYALAQSPWLYDELLLSTAGKPVTPELLASTRRMVRANVDRTAAGVTGAAPPTKPVTPAPRPATPVRTGPVAKGDEPPPESASLSEHEAYYAGQRGRRR